VWLSLDRLGSQALSSSYLRFEIIFDLELLKLDILHISGYILLSLQRALSGTHSKANIKSDMRSIDHIYFNSAIVQTPGPRLRYWSFE